MKYQLIQQCQPEIIATIAHSGYWDEDETERYYNAILIKNDKTAYTTTNAAIALFTKYYPFKPLLCNTRDALFFGTGRQPFIKRMTVLKRYLDYLKKKIASGSPIEYLLEMVAIELKQCVYSIFHLEEFMTVSFTDLSDTALCALSNTVNDGSLQPPANLSERQHKEWRAGIINELKILKFIYRRCTQKFIQRYCQQLQEHIKLFFSFYSEYQHFVKQHCNDYISKFEFRIEIIKLLHPLSYYPPASQNASPRYCCFGFCRPSKATIMASCLQQLPQLLALTLSHSETVKLHTNCVTTQSVLIDKITGDPKLNKMIISAYQNFVSHQAPLQTTVNAYPSPFSQQPSDHESKISPLYIDNTRTL